MVLFDNSIINTNFFTYPYSGVNIDANDYFALKEKRPLNPNIIYGGNQSKYYDLILKQFHNIRDFYQLDDDQYVEFIVRFVQSMPYYTDNSSIKFPLVTFADGCGDCDDKSLLLDVILSQENSNVSLVTIPPNAYSKYYHAMAGIASNSAISTKGGYAMIETTQKNSIIGDFLITLNEPNVRVQKIGNGTKTYETHIEEWIFPNQTSYIVKKRGSEIQLITQDYGDDPLTFFRITAM